MESSKDLIDMASNVAQTLSVLLGIGAWLFTHWKDKRREKIQKTVELLMPFTTSDRLAAGNVLVSRLITSSTKPRLGKSQSDDDTLIDVLDYYEFLCELLRSDVLDGNTVLQLRGRLLGATYAVLGDFINDLRTKHGRQVYSAIQKVVEDQRLDTESPLMTLQSQTVAES